MSNKISIVAYVTIIEHDDEDEYEYSHVYGSGHGRGRGRPHHSGVMPSGVILPLTTPKVLSTSPANLSSGVLPAVKVTATFDSDMDPTTFNSSTVKLNVSGVDIQGLVSFDSLLNIVSFAPLVDLPHDSDIVANLLGSIIDASGNHLANYSWTFSTDEPVDNSKPKVLNTSPASGELNVSNSKTINVQFDRKMAGPSINLDSFKLFGPFCNDIVGSVSVDSLTNSATLSPNANLLPNTSYMVRLVNSITDTLNNHLDDYTWTFTTGR